MNVTSMLYFVCDFITLQCLPQNEILVVLADSGGSGGLSWKHIVILQRTKDDISGVSPMGLAVHLPVWDSVGAPLLSIEPSFGPFLHNR